MDRSNVCGDSIRVVHPLFPTEGDGSIPISPLQLTVYEISVDLAKKLNKLWHSRLPIITNPYSGHTVCYGAEYENRWYAVAIWTDPIAREFNGRNYLELRRMAIAENAPKNMASRMISIMIRKIKMKFPMIVKLISYQDIDVHRGTIYKASGWICTQRSRFRSWTNRVRIRNKEQATGDKIRWEKDLT